MLRMSDGFGYIVSAPYVAPVAPAPRRDGQYVLIGFVGPAPYTAPVASAPVGADSRW